ncbi:MAG: GH3 auxin-responsive promoter family protein [Firmicutes bacterium]|nr:GH3 auxin-responsive promoter family protein [Bacillota bacterium]
MRNPKILLYYFINTLCCRFYQGEYKRFAAVTSPEVVQKRRLKEILMKNEETAYGKKYGFKTIDSIKAYQEKTPLSDYETYRPYIEQISEKEESLLTMEKIITLEPTSGSTKAAKLIPYTKSLKEEFQMGIKPWIYDLYTTYPEIKWGRSYWSITPAIGNKQYTKSGIPIGFEEDSEYFGRIEKYLMNKVFVSPRDIGTETNMERFYTKTVVELLKTKELTLISVWNPTYLLLLLDYMEDNKERLLNELSHRRRKEIRQAVYNKAYDQIWPRLKIISCWCDAYAAFYGDSLKRLFPNCIVQPKGLLSTESFISFPLAGERGGILSVRSHFYEFIDIDTNQICLVNELKTGRVYEVVVTTGGGFYRYRNYDIVKVVGWRKSLPLLIFMGKNDRISDRFGEKLHETFVREAVGKLAPGSEFYLLAPEKNRYILYIKSDKLPSGREADNALRESYHYDYCRKLGQLKELQIFVLTGDPKKEYIKGCLDAGQKLGNIKPACLSSREDWGKYFQGYKM